MSKIDTEIQDYLARISKLYEKAYETWIPRRIKIGSEEQDAVQAITSKSPLCIIGDPGSGKTTVLEMAAYELSKQGQNSTTIPFFVSSSSISDTKISLPELIYSAGYLKIDPSFINQFLISKNSLLLIDALDEIYKKFPFSF